MATKTKTVYFRNVGGKDLYWSASVAPASTPPWPSGSSISVNDPTTGKLLHGQDGSVVVAVVNGPMTLANQPYYATLSLRVYSDEARTNLTEIEEVSIRVDITGSPSLDLTGTLQYRLWPNQAYGVTQQCTLQNDGDIDLTWVASSAGDPQLNGKITISPNSGSLSILGTQVLDVEVDAGGSLALGAYQHTLTATGTPGGVATLPIDVIVSQYAGNVKYLIEWGGPNMTGTLNNTGPGTWSGATHPFGTWLYLTITGAGGVCQWDANPVSPLFSVAYRYSDGYPSGQTVYWNGSWPPYGGNPCRVSVGPSVW